MDTDTVVNRRALHPHCDQSNGNRTLHQRNISTNLRTTGLILGESRDLRLLKADASGAIHWGKQ